jgi:hypothetical protein
MTPGRDRTLQAKADSHIAWEKQGALLFSACQPGGWERITNFRDFCPMGRLSSLSSKMRSRIMQMLATETPLSIEFKEPAPVSTRRTLCLGTEIYLPFLRT